MRACPAHIRRHASTCKIPSSAKAKAQAPAAAPVTSRPLKAGDHLFLVDGSGYIFRAYHALPPLTRKSDGLQVNAVLGFCNMLWKLLRDMKPDRAADPSRRGVRQVGEDLPHRDVSPSTRRTAPRRRTISSRNSR